jgi:hypothetical protein
VIPGKVSDPLFARTIRLQHRSDLFLLPNSTLRPIRRSNATHFWEGFYRKTQDLYPLFSGSKRRAGVQKAFGNAGSSRKGHRSVADELHIEIVALGTISSAIA